jgi:hypothetical protein
MDYHDLQGWITTASSALNLLKEAWSGLPKGKARDEIESKIRSAEEALKRSDVKLAKELGMQLCDCTFPPQIMLWKEQEQAHSCPNLACGRRKQRNSLMTVKLPETNASWINARSGRSWMSG